MLTKIKKFLWFDITPRKSLYAEIEFLEKKVRNLENRVWQLEDECQQVQYDNMELSEQMEQFQDCCNNKSEIIEILKDKYTYVRNYLDRLDSDSSND